MWMFSRTLPRLVDSGSLKMRGKQIQTYFRNINTIGLPQSYPTVLNTTRLKRCERINRFPLYHYANLQTSAKFRNTEEGEKQKDEKQKDEKQKDEKQKDEKQKDEKQKDEKQKIKVIFIKPGGEEIVLFTDPGDTVYGVTYEYEGYPEERIMEAYCGELEMCTTCQVYVDESCIHLFPEVEYYKEELIGYNPLYWKPNSRLACTLELTNAMKEVKFRLPPAEHTKWITDKSQETIMTIDKQSEGLERFFKRLERILKHIVRKD